MNLYFSSTVLRMNWDAFTNHFGLQNCSNAALLLFLFCVGKKKSLPGDLPFMLSMVLPFPRSFIGSFVMTCWSHGRNNQLAEIINLFAVSSSSLPDDLLELWPKQPASRGFLTTSPSHAEVVVFCSSQQQPSIDRIWQKSNSCCC